MSNIEGVVEAVSKDGNIKVNGTWVNAASSEIAAATSPRWKELKGKQCMVEVDDRGRFTHVGVLAGVHTSSTPATFIGAQVANGVLYKGSIDQKMYLRSTAVLAAAPLSKNVDELKTTAAAIETWINRTE